MNGSDDEQHDAHVKCYRIAVAVADGDAVEAAYDKHLAKAGSTDERDAAYRAYVERVSSAWKDAPPTSPPELLLAPGRILARHQPNPGREIASRPKHRRIRRRRHDRGRPQNPDARDGLNPPAHLVRAISGYALGLGASGKRK
jgi:hypothetical protein